MFKLKLSFSVWVLAASFAFRVLVCASFLGLLLRLGIRSLFLDSLAVVVLAGLSEIAFGYLLGRLKIAGAVTGSAADSAAEAVLRKVAELIVVSEQRHAGMQDALIRDNPEIFEEQLHAQTGTKERVYWHYGYMMALNDLIGALRRAFGIKEV
jgi:hypothetical protein